MLLLMIAAAAAAPNPASIDKPRRSFAACLSQFEKTSGAAKMTAAAYAEAVKTACPSEAAALTEALVAYDVAMGAKRANAAKNAALDIADYVATSEERYRESAGGQ